MAGVYSTRFLLATPGDTTSTYEVPPGYVAVIRSVDAIQDTDTALSLLVFVDGSPCIGLRGSEPDASGISVASWTGRQVVNSGELIQGYQVTPCGLIASGYLLASG